MKPCRLALQAFGPFAGREEIDFGALPSDALFLIHGPTGAGKTSLLDGICYALYGETSGSERSAREMRSHHAPDNVPTEVEFEFELGGTRYRIRRSPEQERAALRGKKELVRTPAKAELHVRDTARTGDWTPLVSKTTEVTGRIIALLGFEADQFRQVIMLPQGQFRKLLTADSKDREKILEALFSTETYKRLQERLSGSARQLEQQADAARARRTTLLEQAGAPSEEELLTRVGESDARLAELAIEEKQRRSEDAVASAALTAGEALAARFAEVHTARQALETLAAGTALVDAQRRELEAATRAQNVIPAHAGFADARRHMQQLAEQARKAEAGADSAKATLAKAETALDTETARAAERDAATRESTRLDGLREMVQGLKTAQREHAEADAAARSALQSLAGLQTQHDKSAATRRALQQTIELHTPQANRCDTLQVQIEQQSQRVAALTRLAAAETDLAASRTEAAKRQRAFEAALEGRRHAVEHKEALEARWREGQAAVLAHHLADGQACPVCGSLEHPHPAASGDAVPTEAELRTAAAALQKAEGALEQARSLHHEAANKVAADESTVNTLKSGLPTEAPDPAAARQALQTLERELDAARQAAAALNQAKAGIETCDRDIAAATQAVELARGKSEEAGLKAATAASRVAERSAHVPEPLREDDALERAIAAAKARCDQLLAQLKTAQDTHRLAQAADAAARATLATLRESLAAADRRSTEARETLVRSLSEHGFGDEDGFLQARRSPDAIAGLRSRLQTHDEALAAAKERVARAEGCVADKTPPDLPALKAAQAATRERIELLVAQQNTLKEKVAHERRTLDTLAGIRRELGDIEDRYRVLGDLAAVANGDNSRKLTFQRFVLAALLDDVLRQASLRLKAMSRGRYTLQRRMDVADARKASGLDLEVFDDYTGRARPANTLSGGEGFMASLSLALGLSDVVQSYAGGIQLDTLFIDEGFGSLDPESLDMAMKALIDLQQKGRMVGIISHVDELKRQIDTGIEVSLGAAGSHMRIRGYA
ncbi:SMC family ATPase [Aromatoleum toluclasticum]|uniref:AAA family ATPase n=1 Tax=Aromatoleum toluclasticum TaxID=92003 RepID=UPI001D1810E6|nr:SMC family ATPase [Aromatoleum toluclasticum]MCC4115870.1 SMC family ATPase [Aromatoleum toluclasticum]